MGIINTIHGPLDESRLTRAVGFEDRPDAFVIWVEWRWPGHEVDACTTCQRADSRAANGTLRDGYGALVRRDAHVVTKEPSVVADAIASPVGG